MNKITQIIIVIFVFSITLNAQISEKELMKYMEVSRAKNLLNGEQYDIVKRFSIYFATPYVDTKKNNFKEAIHIGRKKAKNFATNKELIKKYWDTFKNMSPAIYDEIIHFYTTKVGRKLVNAGVQISNMEATEESKKYILRARNTEISEEKERLLDKISKEFNLIKLKMKEKKELLVSFGEQKNNEYRAEKMMKAVIDIKNKLTKYNKVFMRITYLDFNENELKTVLKYASTKAGKTDMRLMYNALINYQREALENLDFFINKK